MCKPSGSQIYYLTGIVSFGKACSGNITEAKEAPAGYYSNVQYFYNWIVNTMNSN